MVSVKHSNHRKVDMGISAGFGRRSHISCDYQLFSSTVCLGRKVEAHGGLTHRLWSAESEHSFILDMAPSVAARVKIYKAKRRSEKIPKD
jgi:hypothetical protein